MHFFLELKLTSDFGYFRIKTFIGMDINLHVTLVQALHEGVLNNCSVVLMWVERTQLILMIYEGPTLDIPRVR